MEKIAAVWKTCYNVVIPSSPHSESPPYWKDWNTLHTFPWSSWRYGELPMLHSNSVLSSAFTQRKILYPSSSPNSKENLHSIKTNANSSQSVSYITQRMKNVQQVEVGSLASLKEFTLNYQIACRRFRNFTILNMHSTASRWGYIHMHIGKNYPATPWGILYNSAIQRHDMLANTHDVSSHSSELKQSWTRIATSNHQSKLVDVWWKLVRDGKQENTSLDVQNQRMKTATGLVELWLHTFEFLFEPIK